MNKDNPEIEKPATEVGAANEEMSGRVAQNTERRAGSEGGKGFFKELLKDIAIAAVIVAAVSVFFRPTLVKETSMEPNIHNNDYLVMSKQAYRFGEIKRGDVVIFKSDLTDENGKSKLLIKRVIGLPGDVITIKDGKFWLNGSVVEEDYIPEGGTSGNVTNLVVPEDEFFAMGDHREVSIDSREIGCIDQEDIKGKAVFRLFPFNKMGAI